MSQKTPDEILVELMKEYNGRKSIMPIDKSLNKLESEELNNVDNISKPQESSKVIDKKPSQRLLSSKRNENVELDPEINQWLKNFNKEQDDGHDQNKCMVYVIDSCEVPYAFRVTPLSTTQLKSGGFSSSAKEITLANFKNNRRLRRTPAYMSHQDEHIMDMLLYLIPQSDVTNKSYDIPAKPSAIQLLQRLLETNRAFLKKIGRSQEALTWGGKRQGQLTWEPLSDGSQRMIASVEDEVKALAFPMDPLTYACQKTNTLGVLIVDLPIKQTLALLNAPHVKPEFAVAVGKKLAPLLGKTLKKAVAFLPAELPIFTVSDFSPVPCLTLRTVSLPVYERHRWNYYYEMVDIESVCVAQLTFDYGQASLCYHDPLEKVSTYKNGEVQHIYRNREAELNCFNTLIRAGFNLQLEHIDEQYHIKNHDEYDEIKWFHAMSNPKRILHGDESFGKKWEAFMANGVPELRQAGWRITMDSTFPYNIVKPDEEWYAEIGESSGIDWFDIELGVTIDGKRLNLVPILLKLLKSQRDIIDIIDSLPKDEPLLVKLDDGRQLALPAERARTLLKIIESLFTFHGTLSEEEMLRMQARDAALLAEIEAAAGSLNMRWFGGERIRQVGNRLKTITEIEPVAPPASFQGELRHYQQDGLNWLQFLREFGLAGILADDMGLGKTVQVLAHIAVEKEAGRLTKPFLVVAPTSLMVNWRMEAARFLPDLKVLTLHGDDRKVHFKDVAQYDLVLTTYPLLPRDKEALIACDFHSIILDEAQTIKNARAKITQIVNQLKAGHRLCMTGTPLENHLGELWSLFNFILPGYLGKEDQFRALFRHPIERDGNMERADALARRVKPFMLRRTKHEVATELPPKTEIIRMVELEGGQRDLYEVIRISMHERVRQEIAMRGVDKSHIIVLDALLKLRQVCCDPSLLKNVEAAKKVKESAKLEQLMDFLPSLIEEGRKVLLFSQFTSMLAIIEEQLTQKGIEYVKITGDVKDRETPVRSFQEGKVPLFLISLKAGGTGLNLTAADTVIHYDPWWNPAVEDQATDRAYRIGQDKPVFVYKFITAGTVEAKILDMQKIKRQRANILFDANKSSSAFDVNDIQALFEPLPSADKREKEAA